MIVLFTIDQIKDLFFNNSKSAKNILRYLCLKGINSHFHSIWVDLVINSTVFLTVLSLTCGCVGKLTTSLLAFSACGYMPSS